MLGDRTGSISAVVHENVAPAAETCRPGTVVHATGRVGIHPRFGPELVVESVRPAGAEEWSTSSNNS